MKDYFRLVNPCFEHVGTKNNTLNGQMSPRMYRSVQLSPLFSIAFVFWQRTGVQLSTAMDAMFNFQNYLEDVQAMETAGIKYVPTTYFNLHETLQQVSLDDLKDLMFGYYDLYNEKKLVLETWDLPYIWEFLWETIRKSLYPNLSCRLLSLFLFDNIEQTLQLQKEIDPDKLNKIVRINIAVNGKLEKYDAGWLDLISVDCTFDEFLNCCRNYWEGKESPRPNWEYLYSGNYSIENI